MSEVPWLGFIPDARRRVEIVKVDCKLTRIRYPDCQRCEKDGTTGRSTADAQIAELSQRSPCDTASS